MEESIPKLSISTFSHTIRLTGHRLTHTQKCCKKAQVPHLVTVNPLPNNMSIRRNTRKLMENSNFPGDKQKMRPKQKTKDNWTVVSEPLISMWKDKNQVIRYFTHIRTCRITRNAAHAHQNQRLYCFNSAHIYHHHRPIICSARVQRQHQSVVAAELTEYFQAAVADPISSIQTPVDTVEQQAEHCQEGRCRERTIHRGRNLEKSMFVLGIRTRKNGKPG